MIAPPYDVLSSDEARERAAGKRWSFLHISKAEIDLPPGTDPYSPAVYAKSAENFARLVGEGVLLRDTAPCYYAYRMTTGEHVQTGIVAAASVADYDSNRIRKHEFTRPDKEDDRVRQIEALGAQTGPVLLAYPDSPEADALPAAAAAGEPVADAELDGCATLCGPSPAATPSPPSARPSRPCPRSTSPTAITARRLPRASPLPAVRRVTKAMPATSWP